MKIKGIVANTLQVLDKKEYTNENNELVSIKKEIDYCLKNTEFYESEALDTLVNNTTITSNFNTSIELWISSSVNAIIKLYEEGFTEIMCLNFASAKNPGGGFINGADAQEESLARASALYSSQLQAKKYYDIHRNMKSCVYTDSMIFSPKTPLFNTDKGKMLEKPILCNFITSAAVNTGVVKRVEPELEDEIENIMRKRIAKVFALAYSKKMEVLVLGAWGCGVFRNDPNLIAKLFKEQLAGNYKNAFRKIIFAIYSEKQNYNEFKNILNL
jgi:uncharacterized protein (TIGR02452 family)